METLNIMDIINRFWDLESEMSETIDTSVQKAELARLKDLHSHSFLNYIEVANYVIYDVCEGEYYDEKTNILYKFSHMFDHDGNPYNLRLENWE